MSETSGEKKEQMSCAEFHKELPFLMESGAKLVDNLHLKSCANCSSLVRDLQYIADQAKLLLPMHDPNPRVWNKIQDSLEREGISRGGQRPRRGLINTQNSARPWLSLGWAAAIAAALLIATALLPYVKSRPETRPPQQASVSSQSPPAASAPASSDESDNQLLQEVALRSPAFKPLYEQNLKNVNAYISDARQSLDQNPGNSDSREHLRAAYAQKAMLYHIATRSLQ